MTEATLRLLEFLAIEHDQLGTVRERSGNANQYSAPAAVYRTSDNRWVSLAGSTNVLYANNCRAIGRPDLIEDPRFAGNGSRTEHRDELNAIFSAWCATKTLHEVLSAFEKAQGTIAPIYSIDQVFADPQVRARDAITTVPDKDFGSVRMQNVVPRFTSDPGRVRSTGGSIGQDNAEVYGGWLELSEEDQQRLKQSGVI
jgi:crotonobetainyl-CoA:carnitine CoA-transferase CaiB-like acyl-CoA transferase